MQSYFDVAAQINGKNRLTWCLGNLGSKGFPDSSVGKESACNSGDPGSILGSGRSSRKGIGFLLQHSWASLVAQLVKNPLAIQKTRV